MTILKPVEKCVDMDGNIAMGGMRSWREVVDFVSKKLGPPPQEDEDDKDEDGGEDDVNDDNDDDEGENEDEDEDKTTKMTTKMTMKIARKKSIWSIQLKPYQILNQSS